VPLGSGVGDGVASIGLGVGAILGAGVATMVGGSVRGSVGSVEKLGAQLVLGASVGTAVKEAAQSRVCFTRTRPLPNKNCPVAKSVTPLNNNIYFTCIYE